MIDVKDSIEACNERNIDNIIYMRRTYNLAIVMTKASILSKFVDMMITGKLSYEIIQYL